MEFRTQVEIRKSRFEILPCEPVLLVGSCFADGVGRRFRDEGFPVTVNPYGTMYNPVSVLHTLQRWLPLQAAADVPRIVFLTLGTNHVYRLKETGEIVDNCEKRPQALFQEEVLSMDDCLQALRQILTLLSQYRADVQVVFTVSPIRYRKYGYHGSQLSKAVLLLAVDKIVNENEHADYFPAYELLMDELRDYRFYAADMLHPSEQAVDYVWERLMNACFSLQARQFVEEWRPLKLALAHKPYHPDSEEYQHFMAKTMLKVSELRKKYPTFVL